MGPIQAAINLLFCKELRVRPHLETHRGSRKEGVQAYFNPFYLTRGSKFVLLLLLAPQGRVRALFLYVGTRIRPFFTFVLPVTSIETAVVKKRGITLLANPSEPQGSTQRSTEEQNQRRSGAVQMRALRIPTAQYPGMHHVPCR